MVSRAIRRSSSRASASAARFSFAARPARFRASTTAGDMSYFFFGVGAGAGTSGTGSISPISGGGDWASTGIFLRGGIRDQNLE